MSFGVGINQHPIGGDPLGTMTGHGVTVIEVAIFCGIQFHGPAFFESQSKIACRGNTFDGRQFAIGNADIFVGSRELYAVAYRKRLLSLLIDADSAQSLGIVGYACATRLLHRQEILLLINRYDAGVAGYADAQHFAAARIAQNVVQVGNGRAFPTACGVRPG